MSVLFLTSVFLFCTGDILAILHEKSYTYQDNVKEEILLKEYVRYLSHTIIKTDDFAPKKIELLTPNNKEIMAILYEKLTTVELQVILSACSVTFMQFSSPDTRLGNLNLKTGIGCKRFFNYLTWHGDNILPLNELLERGYFRMEKKINDSEMDINDVARALNELLGEAKQLNEILNTCRQPSDFASIFRKLQNKKPNDLDADYAEPIQINEFISSDVEEEYYQETMRRLQKYFGGNLLRVQNYFRKVFNSPPMNAPTLSLVDTIKFIAKVSYIRQGLKLEQDASNISAPFYAKSDLLDAIKPARQLEPLREQAPWDIKFLEGEEKKPSFVFLDNALQNSA